MRYTFLTKYIFKKISYITLLFITVIFISFFILKLIPCDPVSAMFSPRSPTKEQRIQKEQELGLDKPVPEQFLLYVKNIFSKWEFGKSYFGNKDSALKLFGTAFFYTFQLAFLSCFFGSLLGVFFGVLAAFYVGTKKSFILDFVAMVLISAPTFVIGFFLQIILAHKFRLFPISGFDTFSQKILPVLTLSLVVSSSVFKTTQTTMLDCLEQPYIKVAYAKGLSKSKIIFKHALKNALIPIVAHICLIFSFLISGSFIVETIYNIKGVGNLVLRSFENRDYPVIQCCIILLALFIAIWNLFLDLIYVWLDPKINKKS